MALSRTTAEIRNSEKNRIPYAQIISFKETYIVESRADDFWFFAPRPRRLANGNPELFGSFIGLNRNKLIELEQRFVCFLKHQAAQEQAHRLVRNSNSHDVLGFSRKSSQLKPLTEKF